MDNSPTFDASTTRALLAAERISREQYAAACGLNRTAVSSYLSGHWLPTVDARRRLHRGLVALGLDREAAAHGS
jgi:transcriptional regulator with XRE-family HTH domain